MATFFFPSDYATLTGQKKKTLNRDEKKIEVAGGEPASGGQRGTAAVDDLCDCPETFFFFFFFRHWGGWKQQRVAARRTVPAVSSKSARGKANKRCRFKIKKGGRLMS